MNYYICKPGDTTPQGPFSISGIKDMLASGAITQEYYFCAEGAPQWHPVSKLIYNRVPAPFPHLPKPSNHLVWSILATIFCCLPLGIYSIIKSASVDGLWDQGRYTDAIRAADTAKNCNLICLLYQVIQLIIVFSAVAL